MTSCVPLGDVASYAVLAASTVTNVPSSFTVVNGNLGLAPGTSVTGFPNGVVTGTTDINNAAAIAAQVALGTVMTTLGGLPVDVDLTGQDLGTVGVLTTGVYNFDTSAQLTGSLVLDAAGDPNAVFVFKIGSTLTTASAATVTLINGADICNIYWLVGSSATLGTTTDFLGNILAQASITMNTGANLEGRALAATGAVTLDGNTITLCDTCLTVICLHEGTLIRSSRGLVPISELRSGDHVFDFRGQEVVVSHNVKSGTAANMVRIKKDAFGSQKPTSDLLIRRGHPLLINGREVPCEQLINGTTVDEIALEKSVRIYTVCTADRTFVDMQGLWVGTWSSNSLENFVHNDEHGRQLILEKQ